MNKPPLEDIGGAITLITKKNLREEVHKIMEKYPDTKETLSVLMDSNDTLAEWYVEAREKVESLEREAKEGKS